MWTLDIGHLCTPQPDTRLRCNARLRHGCIRQELAAGMIRNRGRALWVIGAESPCIPFTCIVGTPETSPFPVRVGFSRRLERIVGTEGGSASLAAR
jgi:hypothetical protein